MRARATAGFSLVEVVVATAILAAGVASIAQLVGVAVLSNRTARETSDATMLAVQKMEQLRAASFDDLAASPGGSLDADVEGFVDYPVGYVRRWSIEPLAVSPADAFVVQVRVSPGGTRLANVRVRSAP